jgi:aspartokinase/homoserine dehydrogenase 1
MAGTPGVAARLFGALADEGVNIVAIAQGASELNISLVVEAGQAGAAQRAIHHAFRLGKIGGGAAVHPEHADVVILGFGQIGRELALQMATRTSREGQEQARVVAVIDRSGYVFDARGLSPKRLEALAASKIARTPLSGVRRGVRATAEEAIAAISAHALSRPILVDVTAADTVPVLEDALARGMDLVLANKRPLAGPEKDAQALSRAAAAQGRRVLHEATVGAGLPIIDTIQKLTESGDHVLRIEGCPSGTLGFLFAEMGRGTTFSAALQSAMKHGYTEPDPRDDLSGTDVARKALILGRLIGFSGELADIQIESLVPETLREVPLDVFLTRLADVDESWVQRMRQAREGGTVLRYRATVTKREARVGIAAVDAASSLASLAGTDNHFSFTTRRYRANPLVITGPGAGAAVTAAGVLNDVLKLAGAR